MTTPYHAEAWDVDALRAFLPGGSERLSRRQDHNELGGR